MVVGDAETKFFEAFYVLVLLDVEVLQGRKGGVGEDAARVNR